MIAALIAVGTSLAVWLGVVGYDHLTYPQRVDKCVELTLKDHPTLQYAQVRDACELVTK